MDKTKIDWCDSSWNPVTGCLHNCEYCYARSIANRFGFHTSEPDISERILEEVPISRGKKVPYLFDFQPTLHKYRLDEYLYKKGRNIFVCSMADLFGEWVPDSWINEVMSGCQNAPQHNYLFLTKNPVRYAKLAAKELLPKKNNMWYGFSCTRPGYTGWFNKRFNTFASIEPILEPLEIPVVDWVIVGAETGRRKDKVIPKREWIEDIVSQCAKSDIPVFMKSSLSEIWGQPLIQEFPEQLRRPGI
jgi:protein gp37